MKRLEWLLVGSALVGVALLAAVLVRGGDGDATGQSPAQTSEAPTTEATGYDPPAISPENAWRLAAIPAMGLPAFPGQLELAEAWASWRANRPARYRFVISGGSHWADFGEFEVFVDGDDVAIVEIEPPDGFNAPEVAWMMLGSIERLFAYVESRPTEALSVSYDPDLGYPTGLLYDEPGSIDEEWRIGLRGLREFGGALPEGEITPVSSDLRSRAIGRVMAIVEAEVAVEETGPRDGRWVVALRDPAVHFSNRATPATEPLSAFDPAHLGPRTLRGHDGERLVVFLGWSRDGWYVRMAAERTPSGLRFLGSIGEFTTIDAELPMLCVDYGPLDDPDPDRTADTDLDVLVSWAEELQPLDDTAWGRALTAACWEVYG